MGDWDGNYTRSPLRARDESQRVVVLTQLKCGRSLPAGITI